MADDKKIIFSMVGVSKVIPPQRQILKNIYLSFFYGAKIGIIGLNGSGKSTLLKIIAGLDKSYQGDVVFSPGYCGGYLEQEPKRDPEKTVKEIGQEGVQPTLDLLAEYDRVNEAFAHPEVLENAYWTSFSAAGAKVAEEILDYVGAAGYATADDSVAAQAGNWGFELADDATVEDFWAAIVANYG